MKRGLLIFRYATLPIAVPFIVIAWIIQACVEFHVLGEPIRDWFNEYLYG